LLFEKRNIHGSIFLRIQEWNPKLCKIKINICKNFDHKRSVRINRTYVRLSWTLFLNLYLYWSFPKCVDPLVWNLSSVILTTKSNMEPPTTTGPLLEVLLDPPSLEVLIDPPEALLRPGPKWVWSTQVAKIHFLDHSTDKK